MYMYIHPMVNHGYMFNNVSIDDIKHCPYNISCTMYSIHICML